jgi:hypothetical protein
MRRLPAVVVAVDSVAVEDFMAVACAEPTFEAATLMPGASKAVAAIMWPEGLDLRIQ